MPTEPTVDEQWYQMLTEGEPNNRHLYHLYGLLPANPRCKLCAAPSKSWGGFIMHLIGRDPSKYNPRFCQPCERFDHPGGAEVPLTMLFADVCGSTALAEQMSALEFSRLMLGDNINITARLASMAGPGEILISDAAYTVANLNLGNLEHQQLELKGKSELIGVRVLRIARD